MGTPDGGGDESTPDVFINDVWGLASTVKSEIIFPDKIIVSQPFDLICRVSLDPRQAQFVDDLWGLAGDLGKTQYTSIDLAVHFATTELDKRSLEKRNPDTKLYFIDHPEIFQLGGHFDYPMEGISLPFVGAYDVIGRVRQQSSYNDFHKDGAGVGYARLNVLADPANSPSSGGQKRIYELPSLQRTGASRGPEALGAERVISGLHNGPSPLALASGQRLAAQRAQQPAAHQIKKLPSAEDLAAFKQRQLDATKQKKHWWS